MIIRHNNRLSSSSPISCDDNTNQHKHIIYIGRETRRRRENQNEYSPFSILALTVNVVVVVVLISNNKLLVAQSSADENNNNNLFSATKKSELIFDSQGLETIPRDKICGGLVNSNSTNQSEIINLVSFAHNNLKRIESESFICVASFLKIIILRYNQIEEISPKAFNQLESVQVLLLDNNQLKSIPSKESLSSLKSLRHLNLADNRIESLEEDAFSTGNANLISLNLKGNPLHRISSNSLINLVNLKTLTLSQSSLEGQMTTLNGLIELRFYHLDRGLNIQTMPENLCESSRKLSTLVIKSNQLEKIPHFRQCQNLLLLDLSYNKIRGVLDRNFTQLSSLIDLYLGFNQINSIDEHAFDGLNKLQVLELNDNQIIQIHSASFVPVRYSIIDLNLSNNKQLTSLSSNGLDRLVSLRAYGNQQLKELPKFKSALSLALTYAYHCCDYNSNIDSDLHSKYLDSNDSNSDIDSQDEQSYNSKNFIRNNNTKNNSNNNSILTDLLDSIMLKVRRFFSPASKSTSGGAGAPGTDKNPTTTTTMDNAFDNTVIDNFSEIILWPSPSNENLKFFHNKEKNLTSDGRISNDKILIERQQSSKRTDNNEMNIVDMNVWKTEVIGVKRIARNSFSSPKITASRAGSSGGGQLRSTRQDKEKYKPIIEKPKEGFDLREGEPENVLAWRGRRRHHHRRHHHSNEQKGESIVSLIDELVLEVKQIRIFHGLGILSSQSSRALNQKNVDVVVVDNKSNVENSYLYEHYGIEEDDDDDGEHKNFLHGNNYITQDDNDKDSELSVAIKLLRDNLIKHQLKGKQGPSIVKERAPRNKRHSMVLRKDSSVERINKRTKRRIKHLRQCLPEPNAFLPCKDLFDTWWLRLGIWCVFLCAFTGNILVIIVLSSVRQSSSASALTSIMWLAHSKRHIDVPRFLVINLAFADLLMAIYLGLLAFVDLSTLGEFKLFAIKWQYSNGCKLAGFLGVLSSELSVFILAIITLERNYAITNAVHLNRRLSLQKAMLIMFVGYLFAFSMALMPLNGISDYRKFSICLPLDIDSNFYSQLYVISLIAINAFSFLLLLSCYLRMYCAIRGSQAWNTNDLRIAKRMSILVLTDFLCWSPIIVVALASLFGYQLIGTNGIKILTIFILPLNSVANPFLYAITTKKFKRDLNMLNRRLKSLVILNCSYCPMMKSTNADNGTENENFKNFNKNYNNNLILMNDNQKNYYLIKSKARKQKQTFQQQTMNYDHFNTRQQQQTNRSRRQRQQQQQQSLAMTRFGTANQVTVNKTTCCSCQQQQQQQHRYNTYNEAPEGSSLTGSHQQLAKPKIVLEAFGSSLNVALAPCGLTASQLIEQQRTADGSVADAASIEIEPYLLPVSSHHHHQQQQQHFSYNQLPQVNNSEFIEHEPVSCCKSPPNNKLLPLNSSVVDGANGRTYLSVSSSNNVAQKQHANCQLNPVCTRRPASACDYRNHERRQFENNYNYKKNHFVSRNDDNKVTYLHAESYNPIINNKTLAEGTETTRRCVCSSCGATNNHCDRSREKLSSSISRILFSPIAKAWSSIQISLSSSAVNSSHNHCCHHYNDQNKQSKAIPKTGQSGGMMTNNQDNGLIKSFTNGIINNEVSLGQKNNALEAKERLISTEQAEATIDDILLMSPSSRLFRAGGERRMSRSCDMITTSQHHHHVTFISPTHSTTNAAGEQQTSTITISHNDSYDDDKRILLATINRIACGHGNKLLVDKSNHTNNIIKDESDRLNFNALNVNRTTNQSGSYLSSNKSRCTRCRSWSPALLGKLEDCFNQFKCKIPRLSNVKAFNNDGSIRLNEQTSSTTNNTGNTESSSCGDDPKEDYNDNDDEDDDEVEKDFMINNHEHGHYYYSNYEGANDELAKSDQESLYSISQYSIRDKMNQDRGNKLNETGKKEEEEEEGVLSEKGDHGDDADDDDADDDDDQFNEPELNWAQKRMNLIRLKQSRRRQLQKQSSTVSESLSTKTSGTMLTNMSISIDSTTGNIPFQIQQQQQQSTSTASSESNELLKTEKPQTSKSCTN